HRLVPFEAAQLEDDGVVCLPRASSTAGAAVHDQVLGSLGDLGIEVVHQHPHRGLLRPRLAGDVRTAGRPNRSGHLSSPITASAVSITAPDRISAAAAASSGATTRSGPTPWTCMRRAARPPAVA